MNVGADVLLNGLEKRGYSRTGAVALLSNAERESGLNPHASGDNGNAYGLFQWNGPRKAAYLDYAESRGKPSFDVDTQLDFLDHEMSRDYPGLKEDINNLPAGPGSALFTYAFERPAEMHTRARERAGLANRLWQELGVGSAQAGELDFGQFIPSSGKDGGGGGAPAQPAEGLDFSQFIPQQNAEGLDFNQFVPQGGLDFNQFVPQKPQVDIRTPPVANATPGGLPIDPNAHSAPESPPQGNTRMIRDLAVMQDVAGTMVPALPLGALGGKILGGIKGGMR